MNKLDVTNWTVEELELKKRELMQQGFSPCTEYDYHAIEPRVWLRWSK